MTPTATLSGQPPELPQVAEVEVGKYPPLSAEARAMAEWYAGDEFARQLLATFEQARLAAIASNPPSPTK